MEKLDMSEQRADNLPSDAAVETVIADEFNLLEVMEFFSDVCLTDSLYLLQTLHESAGVPESRIEPAMTDIVSLKLSPFGRRLRQIH
jgi:hypothetical protein